MNQFRKIDSDDALAERIGREISSALKLRKDPEHKDRWQTEWGTKTNIGIARVVASMIEHPRKD